MDLVFEIYLELRMAGLLAVEQRHGSRSVHPLALLGIHTEQFRQWVHFIGRVDSLGLQSLELLVQ